MDPREKNLPKWAQDELHRLRLCRDEQTRPLINELARLRPKVELLQAHNDALKELLECAARGGHKTAQEIIKVIETYDLTLTKKEE